MQTAGHYEIGASGAPLPPLVKGMPLLGNALSLGQDPVRFLLKSYQQYGSIFRIRMFGKAVTVLAGKEANLFAQQEGSKVFSNHEVFIGLVRELGTTKNLANLEGAEHNLFRRTARAGYSATTMKQQTSEALDFAHHFIDTLPIDSAFDVFTTLQKLTSLQLGKILAHIDGAEYIGDLQKFMNFLLYIHVSSLLPKSLMHLPTYKRAKVRALEIAQKIVAYHIENPPSENRPSSLIDDFLQAHAVDPVAMPMNAVIAASLGPFLAGQDTVAATTAFMLYAILSNRHLYERVQSEVDRLFANGRPQAEDFRHAEALHLTAVETLRRYPVAPFMPQTTIQAFEFNGYQVTANSPVYMAQTLTQFLPQYFDNPFEFNIDRPKAPPGTLNPYGLGPHACIGAGMAELLILINVAAFLHSAKLQMSPTNYRLKMRVIPPAPAKFRVRIIERKNARFSESVL